MDLSNYTERRGGKNEKIPAADRAKEEALHFLRETRPKDRPFALSVAFYPPKPVGESREPGGQWDPSQRYRKLYDNVTFERPYNITQAFEALPPIFKLSENRFYQRWRSDEHLQEGMKNYYALISNVDDAAKQIVDELKRQDLYDNTLIIFTCDNGMMLGHKSLGGKWHPFEESIRVPLIIFDPRLPKQDRGRLDDRFTLNIDLAETILGAAGLKPSPHMQGRDIADLYLGPADYDGTITNDTTTTTRPWRNDFFYDFPLEDLIRSSSLVTKKWKYLQFYHRSKTPIEQLYDLENDPYELNDLIKSNDSTIMNNVLPQLMERFEMVKKEATTNDGIDVPKCERKQRYA
jgi:arylsulfatase